MSGRIKPEVNFEAGRQRGGMRGDSKTDDMFESPRVPPAAAAGNLDTAAPGSGMASGHSTAAAGGRAPHDHAAVPSYDDSGAEHRPIRENLSGRPEQSPVYSRAGFQAAPPGRGTSASADEASRQNRGRADEFVEDDNAVAGAQTFPAAARSGPVIRERRVERTTQTPATGGSPDPSAPPAARAPRAPARPVAAFEARRHGRHGLADWEDDDSQHLLAGSEGDDIWGDDPAVHPNHPHPFMGGAAAPGRRQLVLVPDRTRRSGYLVNPEDFINPDVIHRVPPPRLRARLVVSGLIAFQILTAALAIAAFYIAMWGRSGGVQTAKETPSAVAQTPSAAPARSRDDTVAAVSFPPPSVGAALPFAPPTSYGVYAIGGNQLIELEQAQAAPVDPRTRTQLQIVKPSRVVLESTKPTFVAFRRDLIASAPDKVLIRIAARVAHSMIFDSDGKPVVTIPPTDTWLIRDQGYDLRVSPVRDSNEMVMLRPEDPEFSFPPGRYELMFAGQAYDFVVAGRVTDPAHCVEGVATPRGPVFYECKTGR
jgi:hypothetical protein